MSVNIQSFPSIDVTRNIVRLQRKLSSVWGAQRIRWVMAQQLSFVLRDVGLIDEALLFAIIDQLRTFVATAPAVQIALENLVWTSNTSRADQQHILHITTANTNTEFLNFVRALDKQLHQLGFADHRPVSSPSVVIGYSLNNPEEHCKITTDIPVDCGTTYLSEISVFVARTTNNTIDQPRLHQRFSLVET